MQVGASEAGERANSIARRRADFRRERGRQRTEPRHLSQLAQVKVSPTACQVPTLLLDLASLSSRGHILVFFNLVHQISSRRIIDHIVRPNILHHHVVQHCCRGRPGSLQQLAPQANHHPPILPYSMLTGNSCRFFRLTLPSPRPSAPTRPKT